MKWLRIGAAVVALSATSYAWAAPPEAYLAQKLAGAGGKAPAAGRPGGASAMGDAAARSDANARSYARALTALKPEGRNTTRGANETRVYQTASASVVLIVTKDGVGSGVLISPEGKIVTNLHVVGKNTEVGVIFKPAVEGTAVNDADVHRAKVLRRDEVADLALIEVSEIPGHVKPLVLAAASDRAVQVGADVHAIGHPTGEVWTYTRGIVSQVRRDYEWTTEERLKHKATVIQTQTPINPGNSGGPLIDDNLQVVGINSFKGEGEGLNFAVSAEDVNAFLARTADRLTQPIGPPKDCKSKTLAERVSKDPAGMEYDVDADCDGYADYRSIIPTSRREAIMVLYDDDGDGKLDSAVFDKNHDGKPESGLYDTDGDGEFDMEGRFRNGETEPYRYERIKNPAR